jgi:hypothetical protein
MGLEVVASGIDSLYLAFYGEVRESVAEQLDGWRKEAESAGEDAVGQIGDRTVLVKPHGWRQYRYWLDTAMANVFVTPSVQIPSIYIQLRAIELHALGAERAIDEARTLASQICGVQGVIASRVDLYADVTGWSPVMADLQRFVCRATSRRSFEVVRQLYTSGNRLSGFTFGRGAIVARVYNKTLEISKTGNDWMRTVWPANVEDVWRIEFQFRRGALRSFDLTDPEETIAARQQLWEYGTDWLSLRLPNGNSQRTRWPEDEAWRQLRQATVDLPLAPLVRRRREQAEETRLIRGLLGYASALGARGPATDLKGTLLRAVPDAHEYMRHRGVVFEDVVRKKRERLLRNPELESA